MFKIFSVKGVPQLAWSSTSPYNLKPAPKTIFYLIFGLILFGLGESLLIASSAGVSPWTVLAEGIALHTGWKIGFTTFVVSLTILIFWIPLKQKPGIGTLANAVIIALVIDYSLPYLPYPETYFWQLVQAAAGVLIVGVASGIYLTANLGPGPRDGLMTGLQRVTNFAIAYIRIALEVTVVSVGWLLGGTVGLGTLIFALGVGPCVAIGILLVIRYMK